MFAQAKEKQQNSHKNGREIHELFVLGLSLVRFAGATPDKNQEKSPTSFCWSAGRTFHGDLKSPRLQRRDFCNTPGPLQESLRPFGPEVSRECPSGCLWGPSGPGLRSVQKVSRECPRSVRDTFLTLRGHSRDTFWTLRSPRPEGPQRHPEGHFWDTSGPKGPRDSCSRPGGLQCDWAFKPPVLVSHYSAIGDTISCDAPYSAIGFRGKLLLRYPPLVRPVSGLR